VPLLSRASIVPEAEAANASGTLATGSSSSPVPQVLPPSLVSASGENISPWLGRNATVTELRASAATRPPLSATPGGVTSSHPPPAAGRVNSSQNLFSAAAEPPIATIAHVLPPASVIEVVSGAVAA
jgi:hypothetical protein